MLLTTDIRIGNLTFTKEGPVFYRANEIGNVVACGKGFEVTSYMFDEPETAICLDLLEAIIFLGW